MRDLYFLYLAITMGCTYAALATFFAAIDKDRKERKIEWLNMSRIPAGAKALAVVMALWYYHDWYFNNYSPQGECINFAEELLDKWESGRKDDVISELDRLTYEARPWDEDAFIDTYQ